MRSLGAQRFREGLGEGAGGSSSPSSPSRTACDLKTQAPCPLLPGSWATPARQRRQQPCAPTCPLHHLLQNLKAPTPPPDHVGTWPGSWRSRLPPAPAWSSHSLLAFTLHHISHPRAPLLCLRTVSQFSLPSIKVQMAPGIQCPL